ncbi:MAG TPA: DUF11 domain-containing protein, partial [Methanosarcinales archaeon]|nr:DUF11 domain-containing protein [Methanosarcinales archaeon]
AAFLLMPLAASANTPYASVHVDKLVWDPENEVWVDLLEGVEIGETLTFRIEITNDGDVPFYSIRIADYLSGCFGYADNARLELYQLGSTSPIVIPIEPPDTLEPPVPAYYDEWLIEWMLDDELAAYGLNPDDTMYIYFDAMATDFGWGGGYNCVDVYADNQGDVLPEVTEGDCVDICFAVSAEVNKLVWDPVGEVWVEELTTHVGDTLTFKIEVTNDCDMPFGWVDVVDTLSENLVYIDGTATPTPDDVNPNPDGSTTLYWYLDLWEDLLDPGETIEIEFNAIATVLGDHTNDAWVEAHGYSELPANGEDMVTIHALPKPDLMVIEKYETLENDEFTVTYTVENVGGGSAGESTTCIYIDGEPTTTDPAPALGSGGSYTGTVGPFDCPCGTTLTVEVCADNDDVVDESDESNNCALNIVECSPCLESALCPDRYRWSAYHTDGYEWDPFPDLFRSWMDVRFMNDGPGDAFNVVATISGAPANVVIVDGVVTLGDIPAGGRVWSTDSFTMQVDMSNPQDPDESITWRVEYDDSAGVHHIVENVPQFCAPG